MTIAHICYLNETHKKSNQGVCTPRLQCSHTQNH
nr:MAG TPA: hypothetical protein [Caudoviricetes sp.]